MNSSTFYDDEVVADSEEEGNSFGMQMNLDVQPILPDITNNIGQSGISEINSFTDKASAPFTSILPISSSSSRSHPSSPVTTFNDNVSSSSSSGPLPRPKPRPAYKKRDKIETTNSTSTVSYFSPQVQAASTSNSFQFHMDMPSSIADRAKTRSRNTKSLTIDAIHAVTPRGRGLNMTIPSNDVIELSSDGDELALLSPPKSKPKGKGKASMKNRADISSDSPLSSTPEYHPKPRPKPRPKANKRSKTSHPLSPHAQSTSQEPISLPTSSSNDPMMPIPFHLVSSQLPPSDPPMSTATTCDLPPIETLPNLDTDPLSSPSSLFSPVMSARRKRKYMTMGTDELDSDDPGIEMDVDTRMMPPPPIPQPPRTLLSRPSSPFFDVPNHSTEIVDLSILPSTADTSVNSVGLAKKSKTTKSRKKKDGDDSTENGGSGKAKPKGRGKGKGKCKQKKVELVIQVPKEQGKGKEKEVFKSREFVEDDDEDEGTTVDVSSRKIAAIDKPTSPSPVPGSDKEDIRAAPSKKRKPSDGDEQTAKDKIFTDEEDKPASRSATTKAKCQSKVLYEEDPGAFSTLGEVSLDRPSNVNSTIERKHSKSKKTPSSDINNVEPQPALKENIQTMSSSETSTDPTNPNKSLLPSLSSRYTTAPKVKSTPMSDLIRRVNSLPGSPFPTPQPRVSRLSTIAIGTAYSPYLKSSRSMLSRIAPLHPNRRTPPPPLPPPPPPPKTKKEREREEQWEEELIESVGGITEWVCMTDGERKELRKLKREREIVGWEE